MSELDDLMSLDPDSLTDQDLDKIIAGVRQHRARLAAGGKTAKEIGEKKRIDLAQLGLLKKPAAAPMTRRTLG